MQVIYMHLVVVALLEFYFQVDVNEDVVGEDDQGCVGAHLLHHLFGRDEDAERDQAQAAAQPKAGHTQPGHGHLVDAALPVARLYYYSIIPRQALVLVGGLHLASRILIQFAIIFYRTLAV